MIDSVSRVSLTSHRKTENPSDGPPHESARQEACERHRTLLGLNLDAGLGKDAIPAGSPNDAVAAELDAMTPDDTNGPVEEPGRECSGSVQTRKLVDKDDPWHGLSGPVADVKKCNTTSSQTVNKASGGSCANGQ